VECGSLAGEAPYTVLFTTPCATAFQLKLTAAHNQDLIAARQLFSPSGAGGYRY